MKGKINKSGAKLGKIKNIKDVEKTIFLHRRSLGKERLNRSTFVQKRWGGVKG